MVFSLDVLFAAKSKDVGLGEGQFPLVERECFLRSAVGGESLLVQDLHDAREPFLLSVKISLQ